MSALTLITGCTLTVVPTQLFGFGGLTTTAAATLPRRLLASTSVGLGTNTVLYFVFDFLTWHHFQLQEQQEKQQREQQERDGGSYPPSSTSNAAPTSSTSWKNKFARLRKDLKTYLSKNIWDHDQRLFLIPTALAGTLFGLVLGALVEAARNSGQRAALVLSYT